MLKKSENMTDFPVVEGERFEPFRLNELFDYNRFVVMEFFRDCNTAKDVADKVIREIQYPFTGGIPDDSHTWNHFHGKWCRTIYYDYWQMCSETALFKIGDCEDSSVLTVGGMRLKGVSHDSVYEVFGKVLDADTNKILGGHGWVYARDKSFDTDKFVLVESTLDTPPDKYPEVCSTLDDLKKPFKYNNIIYEPELLFNDVDIWSVSNRLIDIRLPEGISEKDLKKLYKSMKIKKKVVENRWKYEAIAEAWNIDTKPLKFHRSRLAKLRSLWWKI
jgi:hypothetical protein